LANQIVHIGDAKICFGKGETLRTEYSYKYTPDEFQMLAMTAGFQPVQVWMDAQQLFSVHYLKHV